MAAPRIPRSLGDVALVIRQSMTRRKLSTEVPSAWPMFSTSPCSVGSGSPGGERSTRAWCSVSNGRRTTKVVKAGAFLYVYQQLDAQTAPANADPLSLDQRHDAAAYADAAGAVGLDDVVTNAPTAGRSGVAETPRRSASRSPSLPFDRPHRGRCGSSPISVRPGICKQWPGGCK